MSNILLLLRLANKFVSDNLAFAPHPEVERYMEAELITGRTHQLRVQLQHLGYPIAGDDKYGNYDVNKALAKRGLKRMFLHSYETVIEHPLKGDPVKLTAPLPKELSHFLKSLSKTAPHAEAI